LEKLFFSLKDILEKQKQLLEQLLNAARDHNRALRQLEADALPEILRREEGLASGMRIYEEKRKDIAGKLAGNLGIDGDAPLTRFIEKAPAACKEELNMLLASMRDLVYETAGVNGLNEALTRQAVSFNAMMMKALGAVDSQVYAPDGRRIEHNRSLSMLNKEV